uniref:Atlastin-2 n=1 Tax=Ciona intestinalis TaxID=7719 RepID=F6T636_CIOIN|nr:atlastin-2 [Ciona intestinalis]|eukprot:XP_002127593.1 atlastin-2 [Ciona intestinalis]
MATEVSQQLETETEVTEVDRNADQPIPIVVVDDDHRFCLDEEAISSILLKNDVMNLPVAVISVAGAFRKGKSFLLNFFLRYLTNYGMENWLGDSDELLSGFSWRGGSDRDTTGILMWSKVFKISISEGHEIAVVLVDTQGAFDSSSTVKDCATIFALSTMTSSVQVYNISQNIQEDDLQHLELFTEYGRLAMEESSEKPFQSLQFLVRDWSYPYEYTYGYEGGRKLLDKRLELTEQQHEELQRVRTHIRSCFTDLDCFLMPHPGLSVATNPHFNGALKDITDDFKTHLSCLAPLLLSPDKLKTKKINGTEVTAAELVEYYRAYIKIYDGEELPEPKTMLQATAEANNLSAVSKAKDVYINLMEQTCGGDQPFLNPNLLEDKHQEHKQTSLDSFDASRKMGGAEFSLKYREQLETAIQESFDNFVKSNDAKNVFRYARTPAVFFAFGAISYILSGLFGFIYLTSIATVFSLICMSMLVALVVWAYVRYTGDHIAIGQSLEVAADFIWDSFMEKLYETIVKPGTTHIRDEAIKQMTNKIKTN